jgi:hypothetical protein
MTKHTFRTSHPALDPRVRALLAAAAASVESAGPLPGEDEALAAFRASPDRTRRTSMLSPLVSVKSAAAAAIGTGVLLTGGVGAAAAGVLPGAAQDTVSTWLKTVGISVPAGERAEEDGDLPDSGQSPGEETGENADLTSVDEGRPAAADHGERVSDTAKNTTAEGADKGEEISGVASDGRVESGHRDIAGDDNGEPPVSAPNSGGTDTASDATDGQEQSADAVDEGTATADESSDGASSDGSGNRPADD